MSTLEVVVDCPKCRARMARICVLPGGQLSVEWRQTGMEDRPNHPRGAVLTRPWQTSEVPLHAVALRFNVWQCTCREVRCGGRLVLDSWRVRQLAARAMADGWSIRWHPDADAVERSEGLRPYVEGSFWNGPRTERGDAARRLARSEPPPLTKNSVRRLGIRT